MLLMATIGLGWSCQTTPPIHNKEKEITISSFGQKILTQEADLTPLVAHQVWLGSVPKLNQLASDWIAVQSQALQVGGWQSLSARVAQVRIPNDTSISYLDLSNRNLYYIPDKIAHYKNLQYLSLRYNTLQEINPKIGLCTKLRRLDLSSNQLPRLPFGIVYLSQIQELNLTDNKLTSLPNFFAGLSNLKVLDISNLHGKMATGYNNIQQFPSCLLKMKQIEKLFLDRLPLQQLPPQLHQMAQLKVVSLNGATQLQLNQAFEALRKVEGLIALDLSFIGRTTLPKSIAKLQKLKVLIWYENGDRNAPFVRQELERLLPNTKIYYGDATTPFLRGNSIKTILAAGKK
jgi:Leucine-rich repeat (LRR) protein